MARDATRRRELTEEPQHAVFVFGDLGIDLRVRALEIDVRNERRTAVPRARDVDHVRVALFDEPIEVDVDERQAGRRSPVPEQSRLDVIGSQRLAQQRVSAEVDLTDGQVIRSAPVPIDEVELGMPSSTSSIGTGGRLRNYLTVGRTSPREPADPRAADSEQQSTATARALGDVARAVAIRLIKEHEHERDLVHEGPGHGGPALVANVLLSRAPTGRSIRDHRERRRHAALLPSSRRRVGEPRERRRAQMIHRRWRPSYTLVRIQHCIRQP